MHSSAFQLNARSAMCLTDKPSLIKTMNILDYYCTLTCRMRSLLSTLQIQEAAETQDLGEGQHMRHFKNRKIRKVRLEPSDAEKSHSPCQEDEQYKQWMPVCEVDISSPSQQRNVF